MHKTLAIALKSAIAIAFIGALFLQVYLIPIGWFDNDPAPDSFRRPTLAALFLCLLCFEIIGVCVWKLVTRVARQTVFSVDSFKYVNAVIGSLIAIAALLVALGATLAPGEEVAPGLVLILGGLALVFVCVALVVLVMRALLRQAISRDQEATALKSELDEVI